VYSIPSSVSKINNFCNFFQNSKKTRRVPKNTPCHNSFWAYVSKISLLAADESIVHGLASLLAILIVASNDGLGIEGNHEDESNNTENENECECAAVALITGSAEEQAGNNNGRSRADGRTNGAHEGEYAAEVLTAPILSAERNTEVGGSAHEHCDEDHGSPENGAVAEEAENACDNHEDAGDDHSLLGTDLGIEQADDVRADAAEDHNSGHNSAVLSFADAGVYDLHGLAHETDSAGEQTADSDGAEPELLALDGVEVVPNGSLLVFDFSQHDLGGDFGSEGLVVITVSAALLGIVLNKNKTDNPANDGYDEEGQEGIEDGTTEEEGVQLLTHSAGDANGGENRSCEGSEKTVCDGECQSSDTHNGTLSGGEPLADQEAESQGGVQNGYDVNESISNGPQGAGEPGHDYESQNQRNSAEDGTESLDALHLGDEADQNDLDNDADDCAGRVDRGDLVCATIEVGEDVQGILGEDLEGDVGDCLVQDQHPASESEANGFFLLHCVFSSRKK